MDRFRVEASDNAAERLRRSVTRHMPVLDGWRGLAVLTVVLHNAGYIMDSTGTVAETLVRSALAAGWVGVTAFFVLSGFLISGILLDTIGTRHYFRDFYVRRTLRIFPLYYGFLLLSFVVFPDNPAVSTPVLDQKWYWLYLSNWNFLLTGPSKGLNHLWSLGVEEQFYLVWPVLVFVATPRRFLSLVGVTLVLTATARLILVFNGSPSDYLYGFTVSRMDALAVGGGLAFIARDAVLANRLRKAMPAALAISGAGIAWVVVSTRGFEPTNHSVLLVGQSFMALFIGLCMLASVAPSKPPALILEGALRAHWLQELGKYSYAIYSTALSTARIAGTFLARCREFRGVWAAHRTDAWLRTRNPGTRDRACHCLLAPV